MDINDEKQHIYEQMKLILEERRKLTEIYYEWKYKLGGLNQEKGVKSKVDCQNERHTKLKKESDYQQYMLSKKQSGKTISYQVISLTIASILKESGRSLSNKEILKKITEKKGCIINIENLTCNILPRVNKDTNIPVEKVHRGFWQYRLR